MKKFNNNKITLITLARRLIVGAIVLSTSLMCQIVASPIAMAQSFGASGLPLPRFVSLKAKRVNMRVGPGRDYQVQWLYIRKNLPMEVIQEFGNWRKVRDPNGVEGWILHSLLSGNRVVIVTPWDIPSPQIYARESEGQEKHSDSQNTDIDDDDGKNSPSLATIDMFDKASTISDVVARIEAGTLAIIDKCAEDWCKLMVRREENSDVSGYVRQSLLWGVYPDENVKN